jgi:hypothetical protein
MHAVSFLEKNPDVVALSGIMLADGNISLTDGKAVVGGQRELNVRNWTTTAIVVIGTSLSIYLLARVTEQRKNEFRKLLVMMFKTRRPPEIA